MHPHGPARLPTAVHRAASRKGRAVTDALFGVGSATFSPCRRYRYTLTREGLGGRGTVCWLMLNPSTADADVNDPTIRRCIDFTQRWGYGKLLVLNLYAYRATDPAELLRCADPCGPDNDRVITELAPACDLTVCAWGAHPMAPPRARAVEELLGPDVPLWCLSWTKEGEPRHPLYLPAALDPEPYNDAAYTLTPEATG